MTVAEKILARASGRNRVEPGDYVDAAIDRIAVTEEFYKIHRAVVDRGLPQGLPDIWDRDRFHLLVEHLQPASSPGQAARQADLRKLVKQYGIRNFVDSTCGVIHRMMLESAIVPGELALGNDSHSCAWGALNCAGTGMGEQELAYAICFGEIWFKVPETIQVWLTGRLPGGVSAKDLILKLAGQHGGDFALYRALQFAGPGVSTLSFDNRITLATHAVEVGAKFGLFPFDDIAHEFVTETRGSSEGLADTAVSPDPDAVYSRQIDVDLQKLEPQIALPHTFENVVSVSSLVGTRFDQARVGSCANGNLEDIATVARVLRGRQVSSAIRLYVQPNSWGVYRAAMDRGYLGQLLEAGAQVLAPGCHLCHGVQGSLSADAICLTSTTRNYRGRMGSTDAQIYLASPATVAASAVAGAIADPREILS